MIILIPSYKRTDILKWVIGSVLQSDIESIEERVLLLIVNNYYPNQPIVDKILAEFRFEGRFECDVIHREATLPAVESWYAAMTLKALENEVIVILGDDDLLLPWGLENRFHEITRQQADMILSDFCQRVYFYGHGDYCWPDIRILTESSVSVPSDVWDFHQEDQPNTTFISNHCYRYTEGFRRGWATAMAWCGAQQWVPRDFSTGNLPGYLPYAIKASGGSVYAIPQTSVIRGSMVEEALHQEYSDGGNTAFYNLLIYNTFNNTAIHADTGIYAELRRKSLRAFMASAASIFFNEKIPARILLETWRRSGIGFDELLTCDWFNNFRVLLRTLPGLRGYRMKAAAKKDQLIPIKAFIESLKTSLTVDSFKESKDQ